MHGSLGEYVAVESMKKQHKPHRNCSFSKALYLDKKASEFMTFDGIFTKWMMDEEAPQLVGGRITIHQNTIMMSSPSVLTVRTTYLFVRHIQ